MQIHELNTFNGTPGGGDFLAVDSGFDTAKISAEAFLAPVKAETEKVAKEKINAPDSNGEAGQLLRTNGDGSTEWVDEGLPSDEQTDAAVTKWLNEHPEATTTVQDGSITEAKIAQSLIDKRMKYETITGATVTPANGFYIYDNCTINDISAETVLTGDHVFRNCTIGTLFVKGGTYEFYNCTFDYIKAVNTRVRVFASKGKGIDLIGDCNNSIIDGCEITAELMGCIMISGGVADNVKISNNTLINMQSATLTEINLQCINTHGVSNSVIENNYCYVDTDRYAIDLSGNGTTIRSYNNVVRNNIVPSGQIVLYATKDVIVCGNIASTIQIGGVYLSEDYGTYLIHDNLALGINIQNTRGELASLVVYIYGNVLTGNPGILTHYALQANARIIAINNSFGSAAINNNSFGKLIELSNEMIYIAPNSSIFIPACYVVASEISTLTADSYYNGGLVANNTNDNRYVIYRKINIMSGQKRIWNQ